MKPIRRAALTATTDRGVLLDCGQGLTCQVSLLKPDLGRVCFIQDGAMREPRSWMVPPDGAADVAWEGRDRRDETSWPDAAHTLETAADRLTVRTAAMVLTISMAPFALSWALPDGTVFAQDRPTHPYLFGRRRPDVRHAFARDPADRYYGLGDKTGPLDLHGRRLRTSILDSLGYDPARGDPLYKHWPFVITRDGNSGVAWGVFYDSMAEAVFDLGCEHDNYHGPYRSYEASGGDLDYYVFPGPNIADVTRKFLDLTGRPTLPPRWTLGYAQTAMAIADVPDAQARMSDFIARCAAEAIPVSAFHFGSGYTSIGPKRYVFNWNRSKFPDPEGLMRQFHAAGMKLVANLKPCLLDDHPGYGAAQSRGAFVVDDDTGAPSLSQFWDGEGAHLDFTNPAAIAWWQEGLARSVLDTGFDAAWNDNNEYGFHDEAAVCHGFGTAMPLDLARPLQSLLMTRASLEGQAARVPGERQFTVTRAGCPGVQRYAQTWSGDNTTSWETLKWNLRTGLQMGLSGMGNIGHDVGGFAGPVPGAELLIRWTQTGLLHPRFIMNSWKPDGVYTSPWLQPEAVPAIRAAIQLRYRLIPYLYSLMHESSRPPLRPTFVVFDDPACFADCDDVMLGPFLLAAPVVTEGARDRAVYLPAGPECWFDFWSGEQLTAGAATMLAAPLDRLPLAVAAGGILPMTDSGGDFARLHDEPSRRLLVFPGPGTGGSQFTLIEDDGITRDGPVCHLTIDLEWTPGTVRVRLTRDGAYDLGISLIAVSLPAPDRREVILESGPGAPTLARVMLA